MPNIMFVMDDSGSMAWDFLPDAASVFNANTYGKWSSQCNGLAYNPATTYVPPMNAAGVSLGNADVATYTGVNPSVQTGNYFKLELNQSFSKPAVGDTPYMPGFNGSANINDGQTVTIWRDANNYVVGKHLIISGYRRFRVAIVVWSGGGTSWSSSNTYLANGEPVPPHFYTYNGTQPRLGFSYQANGDVNENTFKDECDLLQTTSSTKFTKVLVSSLSTANKQNYANWAKYYRDRMITMKSAVSRAFQGVDNRYRVGYSTINTKTAAAGDDFLDISDFVSSQKTDFYTKLNSAFPSGSTPLRAALAKAGRYYANKASGQVSDPVQYACQRNFTILSTDGYWNTGGESSSYGPFSLSTSGGVYDQYANRTGNYVGQQDGDIPRPMLDGNSMTVSNIDSWTTTTVTTITDIFPRTSTTTLTLSTVTDTITARQDRTTYSGFKVTIGNDSIPRPSNNWVVVTLSNHGYSTGDRVYIGGGSGSDSAYNGTFTVERVSSSQFRYQLSSRPGTNGSGNWTVSPEVAQSCSSGQRYRSIERKDTGVRQFNSSTTKTVTESTILQRTVKTQFQTHTYTVDVKNGVTQSPVQVDSAIQSLPDDVETKPEVTATNTTSSTSSGTTSLSTDWTEISGICTSNTSGSNGTANVTPPAVDTVVSNPPATTANKDGTKNTTTSKLVENTDKVRTVLVNSSGGVGNTLADVASYYYRTDLRTSALGNCTGAAGIDVCSNDVPGTSSDDPYISFGDAASWQHMTTFTLGMGISGTLLFDKEYLTSKAGTFKQIVDRELNWPNPVADEPTAVDDLWHAAVNGRGQYFSAGDPASLTEGLTSALNSIQGVTGAASAASTSSLQPVAGDNDIYVAQFKTQEWIGDVLAFTIIPETGAISATKTWSAQTELEEKLDMTGGVAARKVYFAKPDMSALEEFTYAKLKAAGLEGNFDNFCSKAGANGGTAPAQCTNISDKTEVNKGTNLVDYLRGDKTKSMYRTRTARLGDIINASPLFVGKPSFRYTENNYQADFATPKAGRQAVILAAANDGMLHAFKRETGEELWAYVPSFVLPSMYKLADTSYADNHQYMVDGSPQMGDVYIDGAWKTIVVGGLNRGGRGYYALDVTNPAEPKLMWEFKHDNLGYTFGNPIITKRKNGDWVVVVASGYNNVSPGDGNGHLFVLNAKTGVPDSSSTISTFTSGTTPAGTTGTPSGLAKINSWVDSELVNTSERFYGGDLLGNLWRFDIDNVVAPNKKALRLAELKDKDGNAQPVTTRPIVAAVEYNATSYPVVYVGTGRYLGLSDLGDKTGQSMYAIKDPLTNTARGNVRNDAKFIKQTIVAGVDANGQMTRTSSAGVPVAWNSDYGWYVDFPTGGERVSVNGQLALNTLYIGTNIPTDSACDVGGDSFLYQFNIATGVATATYVGNVLVQGLTLVQLTTSSAAGTIVSIITRSDGSLQSVVGTPTGVTGVLRRTSWRELVD